MTPLGPKDTEYTCVTFEPDLARFKMASLDDATVGLLAKRAYDVAGCASGFPGKALKVYLNGTRLSLPTFQDVSGVAWRGLLLGCVRQCCCWRRLPFLNSPPSSTPRTTVPQALRRAGAARGLREGERPLGGGRGHLRRAVPAGLLRQRHLHGTEAVLSRGARGKGLVASTDAPALAVRLLTRPPQVKGGQHVNMIADQVVQKLMAVVKKRNKGQVRARVFRSIHLFRACLACSLHAHADSACPPTKQEVKGHQIKNHLAVFVNALIENPAFDSQTKETLTTRCVRPSMDAPRRSIH